MEDLYNGPFFVKNPDGSYSLAKMCKECAFGDEEGCCLTPCTYLYCLTESKECDSNG